MKFLKGIALGFCLILTACSAEKGKTTQNVQPNNSVNNSSINNKIQTNTNSHINSTNNEQETMEIKLVKLDYSSFEKPEYTGAPYVYLNKPYVVKIYAYGEDQETPLDSNQIEYFVAGYDGSTQIDYVKYEQGKKPNEFIITALPKSLTVGMGHFDLRGRAKLKNDKIWLSAYNPVSSVNVIEETIE